MTQLVSVVLPKPHEFTDTAQWAIRFTQELEQFLTTSGAHVRTKAIPQADLPSAVRPGVILTVLDDAEVGVAQVYSDGTQWLRVLDDQAIDSVVVVPVQRLHTPDYEVVLPFGASGFIAFADTGNITITGNDPATGVITFNVPEVDVSPARLYYTGAPNLGISWAAAAGEQIVTGFGDLSVPESAADKKYEVSWGFDVHLACAVLSWDWVEFILHQGTAGNLTDGVVYTQRKTVDSLVGITSVFDRFDLANFEITAVGATDKLTVGVIRGDLMAAGAPPTYTVSPSATYPSHIVCTEVL